MTPAASPPRLRSVRLPLALLLVSTIGAAGCRGGQAETGTPRRDATGPAVFVERAAELGLDFTHFNGMSGRLYIAEMVGPGAALLDYDGDGDLDAYLLQGHMLGLDRPLTEALVPPRHALPLTDRLYRNDLSAGQDGRPEARFTDVTEESGLDARGYGMGVAAGDVDNDGDVDLYVTNFGRNQLLLNEGDGTFSDVTAASGTDDERWSVPAVFFDYDRDGLLDLFVGNYLDFRLASHKDCPSDAGHPDYCGPMSYEAVPDRLFRNRGGGRFEDVTIRAGLGDTYGKALGAIAADFDGDGWIDLYVANDGVSNQLWRNRGDGTFEDTGLLGGCAVNAEGEPEASMGVDAGDFDNDGDEDLFMTHLTQETNTLYVNDGRGDFTDRSMESGLGMASFSYTGFGTAWLDFDNDGLLDVLVVNGAVKVIEELYRNGDPFPLHERNQLFRNSGSRFEELTDLAGPAFEISEVSRGAAFGDVDNDGDTDVLIANNAGPARLLVNEAGQDSGWVGLRLLVADGTRDALGAFVGLSRDAGPALWRRVRAAGSYGSANDPRLLFGLGNTRATGVVVRWPSGREEEFPAPPSGRYTTLREGEGRPAGAAGGAGS